LSDSQSLLTMRSNARNHADTNFSLSGQARSFLRLYEQVLADHRLHV
jgi:hypothetical protein